ncbi:MAG TPA: response regulator [Candidatus Kryptonia bacterium]|nr:response regulator [Candidatus Kryptonia bacterium]
MAQGKTIKTVLVTDDDATLRTITVKLIEARGHRVLTADSGERAIEVFKAVTPIDLLVLDLIMTGMDGLETMAQLRELGFGEVPVVVLTAKASDENILDGYRAGAGYYLTKPFKPAALINIVDYLIGDLSAGEREQLALRL